MVRPADKARPLRDENLRLIFAAQERFFIAARLRAHILALTCYLAWISAILAIPLYLAQLESPSLLPDWARVLGATLILSAPFALTQLIGSGVCLVRYLGYQREHRRFLARYGREWLYSGAATGHRITAGSTS